ncbi:hypothetical protein PIB30_042345 [Stylosanthes scabra]|uniref:Uncharacterized protein n=1 Tax=Stylosanthes scabra TaxID=79078 RepID=A0ABU6SF43_9FABA|nr:hypothetical protein [Stylosanthes scabra]
MKSDGHPVIHYACRSMALANPHGSPGSRSNIPPQDNHRDNGPRGNPKPPRKKFDNYTPLVASITEIYHQVSEKGVFPKARPLKGRTQNAKDRSLFCNYHQGYGHRTQDCYDLKDAIEQAIRDDKLNETSERERSPRPESWNPKYRRDDDEPVMEIAVITGSNAPKKSKSALKKDLKILAAVQTPLRHFRKEDFKYGLVDSDSPLNPGGYRRGLEHHVQKCLQRPWLQRQQFKDTLTWSHGTRRQFHQTRWKHRPPDDYRIRKTRKTIMAEFVVLQDSTAYNVILGRKTINDFRGAVLTKFLVTKYEAESGKVGTIFGNREAA